MQPKLKDKQVRSLLMGMGQVLQYNYNDCIEYKFIHPIIVL